MRFAALAALSILVVLPADALQQSQYASLTPTCDNAGRCTTLNAIAPVTGNSDVAWLTDVAICPIGSPWAALRLRTVCSKAGGGAIRTTVTPRSIARQRAA